MTTFNQKINNQKFSPVFRDGIVGSQTFDEHTYVWYGKRIDPSKFADTDIKMIQHSVLNGDFLGFNTHLEDEFGRDLECFIEFVENLHSSVILYDFKRETTIGDRHWRYLNLASNHHVNCYMNTNCSDKDCLVEGGEGSLEITLLYIGKECSSGKMK